MRDRQGEAHTGNRANRSPEKIFAIISDLHGGENLVAIREKRYRHEENLSRRRTGERQAAANDALQRMGRDRM